VILTKNVKDPQDLVQDNLIGLGIFVLRNNMIQQNMSELVYNIDFFAFLLWHNSNHFI
jgi:hypothetical protein